MAKGPSSVNEEGQPGVDPGNAVWNRKVLGVRVRGWRALVLAYLPMCMFERK
jgi:hypothetical protein